MSNEIREQLSALIDDELSEVEQPLLLGRLQRDAALQECMGHYQLIGESLRGTTQLGVVDGVASRVRTALAHESAAQHSVESGGWWKPIAGFAVAASVALVAVTAVTSVRNTTEQVVPAVASLDEAVIMPPVSEQQWDRIEPQIDKRLSGYLVNHNEYAASRGVQGVVPYARVVGYQNDMR